MFSKSKRFDDKVPVGPSVGAYDVKLPLQGSMGPTTFDRSRRWEKQTESSSRGKENLNTTADESYLRATPQKELFSSARKPAASVSKMSAVLDRASISKLKEAELELCQLRHERMSLLQQVGVAQEEAARVEQQLLSCRRDKVSLESRLASLQKEKKDLLASITKLEGMVAKHGSLKLASGKVHIEATNLRHQLEVVQSELATVRQEGEAASRRARDEKRTLESDIASLSEQLAAKEVDFVMFSARTKEECGCRLKVLQESMVAVRSEFEAKSKHLEEALKSEKEACEQQVSSLTEKLQTENCRVEDLAAEVQSLRAQLSAVDERENTLRDQCKQKEAECASMAEELKSQNDMNMQALQSMTSKCMEIEDELDHERKSYKQTQAVTKAELASMQTALKTMTVENAALRDAYRDLQRRLSASELISARLEAELEVVRHTAKSKEQKAIESLSQAEAASEELRERLSMSEKEVRALQGQQLTLEQLAKTTSSELERVLEESKKAEAKLVQDVALKDSEVEKMHTVIAELTEQARQKEERISHLLQRIQDEKEISKKQAETLRATEQRINVCDERLVLQLKDEIDELKREKEKLSSDADRWEKKFHELQSKYLPYQAQIDQLVSRIKGLQSQSDLAESEAMRMGQQFAQLVGHTNHRQKIQYVQKLTNENLSLKKEVMHLREEEMKVKRKLRALEDESSRLGDERKPLATRNC